MTDAINNTVQQLSVVDATRDAMTAEERSRKNANEAEWRNVYEKLDKPFLVAFGGDERVTIGMKEDFMTRIPNPTEITLEGVGHFVQEEAGPELASIINDFIAEGNLD